MISIPPRLLELLNRSDYDGPTKVFATACSKILLDNKMPFFPDYTDHGEKHIEGVLDTVCRLIPLDVWDNHLLSAEDATVIVCSTLLHDLAMHVREEGFYALVHGETNNTPMVWFRESRGTREGDRPWSEIWSAYERETWKFGDRQLIGILGPPPEGEKHGRWGVQRLSDDVRSWSKYDRLIVGEFLRRHHARLAHEMAYFGFPGLEDNEFPVLDKTIS